MEAIDIPVEEVTELSPVTEAEPTTEVTSEVILNLDVAPTPPTSHKQPNRQKLNAQLDAIKKEAEELIQEQKKVQTLIEALVSGRRGEDPAAIAAKEEVAAMRAAKERIIREGKELRARRDALREATQKGVDTHGRNRHRFSSIEDVDREIAALEQRHSHTSGLTAQQEREIVQEIAFLRSKVRVQLAQLTTQRAQLQTLQVQVASKDAEISGLNSMLSEKMKVLDAVREHERATDAKVEPHRERVKQLSAQIREVKGRTVTLHRAYDESKRAWDVYFRQLDAYNAAQQRRQAEQADERARHAAAAEEARPPYEPEVALCRRLEAYLRSTFPHALVASASEEAPVEPVVEARVARAVDMSAFAGMQMRKRYDLDDSHKGKKKGGKSACAGVGAGAGAGAAAAKHREAPLHHGMDTFGLFAQLQLTPPATLSAVPSSIKALVELRHAYEAAPKGSMPKIAGAKRAAPTTKGEGEEGAGADAADALAVDAAALSLAEARA